MSTVGAVGNGQTANQQNSSQSVLNPKSLGKDAYLQLLVTELRYQDPMEPMQDKDFIAQMAQLSALEETQNLNSKLDDFLTQQKQIQESMLQLSASSQAASLIGREIKAKVGDEELGGIVDGFKISQGAITVLVGDEEIPLEDIYQVAGSEKTQE